MESQGCVSTRRGIDRQMQRERPREGSTALQGCARQPKDAEGGLGGGTEPRGPQLLPGPGLWNGENKLSLLKVTNCVRFVLGMQGTQNSVLLSQLKSRTGDKTRVDRSLEPRNRQAARPGQSHRPLGFRTDCGRRGSERGRGGSERRAQRPAAPPTRALDQRQAAECRGDQATPTATTLHSSAPPPGPAVHDPLPDFGAHTSLR